MSSSTPNPQAPHATERTPGFDVARALAIFGMVVVNFRARMEASESGPAALAWVVDRLEGRAAALFVVLAGLGVSLRSRRARLEPELYLAFERRALVERALIVSAIGLLHLHFWEWDILHCYGVYLILAAFSITASDAVLLVMGALFIAGSTLLQASYDYENFTDFWTPLGVVKDVFFNGLHPVFPWMTFLCVGMWLGRRDVGDPAVRRKLLIGALAVSSLAEGIDSIAARAPQWLTLDEYSAFWLSSGPRPARPLYSLAAGATAVAVICLCVSVTGPRARARWVVALTATGQMAFTLYLAHTVAIVIPQEHELWMTAPLSTALVYGIAFYAAAVLGSVWWRNRFPHGPIEGLIRQVTGRTNAAPWGGVRLSELPPPPEP